VSDAAPAVERWLAWRYLATRQREGFVSFIAIFSLIGVALGVATLIVVLSVMGGFRQQLLGRIIGLNGHVVITARDGMLQATEDLLARLEGFPGVVAVHRTLERQPHGIVHRQRARCATRHELARLKRTPPIVGGSKQNILLILPPQYAEHTVPIHGNPDLGKCDRVVGAGGFAGIAHRPHGAR